jgi:hypothetical protein
LSTIILLNAIEAIDDKYIMSVQACLGYNVADTTPKLDIVQQRWPTRKAFICIAAIIALLLASFTVAMAVSEDFREFIFTILNIETKETLPSDNGNAVHDGTIDEIGGADMDGQVSAYYFKGNGVLQANNGLIYTSRYDNNNAVFYDITQEGLVVLKSTRVEFPFSFRGTDFDIKFDYTLFDGKLYTHVLPENLDVNPYKYGWNIYPINDNTDKAWLTLPYLTNGDYGEYPLLLNVCTCELTDVFASVPLDSIITARWQFADDMSYALIMGYAKGYETEFWICDIEKKTLTNISELIGRTINDCYILEGNRLICYVTNESGFDVLNYDISTGSSSLLVENTQHYYLTQDGSGFRSIEYYGGQGRHALILDGNGGVTLIDLYDGNLLPLTGITNDATLLSSESPDGEHIMFAFRDTNVSDSYAMYKIGILDTQTGVLKMLERENYEVRNETLMGWLANNCISVLAYDESEDDGWYMYVYDFR